MKDKNEDLFSFHRIVIEYQKYRTMIIRLYIKILYKYFMINEDHLCRESLLLHNDQPAAHEFINNIESECWYLSQQCSDGKKDDITK